MLPSDTKRTCECGRKTFRPHYLDISAVVLTRHRQKAIGSRAWGPRHYRPRTTHTSSEAQEHYAHGADRTGSFGTTHKQAAHTKPLAEVEIETRRVLDAWMSDVVRFSGQGSAVRKRDRLRAVMRSGDCWGTRACTRLLCPPVEIPQLKDFRHIATRYDKLARNYLASVCLAVVLVCGFNESGP